MSRLELRPVPRAVASAVVGGSGIDAALTAAGLSRVRDWPHADTIDALRGLAEHAELSGEGSFLVVGQDEAVIGDCGWFGPPDEQGRVEIGYGLAVSARRQGLGSEAVRQLLGWVGQQPAVRTVTAEVLVGNEPSLRLLAGLGFALLRQEDDRLVLAVTASPR